MQLFPGPNAASHSTIAAAPRTAPRKFDVRALGEWRLALPSDLAFALVISALLLAVFNLRFWQESAQAMWRGNAATGGFLVSLALAGLYIHATLLLLMPGRRAMRIAASVLCVLAAAGSYFIDVLGAVMNRDMMQNVFQTDFAETSDLVTPALLGRLLLGLVPAVLVWRVQLPQAGFRRPLLQRAGFIFGGLVVVLASALATSASYAVYLREHKPVRSFLNPVSILWGTAGYLTRADASAQPLVIPGGPMMRVTPASARPMVLFLVIGETARAANFQLGGYARHTNPHLAAVQDLVYLPKVSSCGTSTAQSLPCLFSHLGRDRFTAAGNATHYANLLDLLQLGGIDVEWRDNNSGCKGLCARVQQRDYFSADSQYRMAQHCAHAHCYDEVMLQDLPERLRTLQHDTVIVFHQNGSHGPAYSERYPPQFEVFKPACHTTQIDSCSREEVVNAYDNSILYTDYNVAKQIELLRQSERAIDSALIYVSDHGESLGEQGIYLHGMPYAFAPAQQKEVPMLMWMSAGIEKRLGIDANCAKQRHDAPASHDNLYHTVMGLMAVRNATYAPELDLFARCRQ